MREVAWPALVDGEDVDVLDALPVPEMLEAMYTRVHREGWMDKCANRQGARHESSVKRRERWEIRLVCGAFQVVYAAARVEAGERWERWRAWGVFTFRRRRRCFASARKS